MMPSEPASDKPWSTALIVDDDETLIAGYANPRAFALSSISAYWSGVATGMPQSLAIRLYLLIPTNPTTAFVTPVRKSRCGEPRNRNAVPPPRPQPRHGARAGYGGGGHPCRAVHRQGRQERRRRRGSGCDAQVSRNRRLRRRRRHW